MSSWEQRGKYKRPRLLLQRHGHFDWIYAVVVATSLMVMVTYLPYRTDEGQSSRRVSAVLWRADRQIGFYESSRGGQRCLGETSLRPMKTIIA